MKRWEDIKRKKSTKLAIVRRFPGWFIRLLLWPGWASVMVSCAPAPYITVAPGFDANERVDIAKAIAKWNTVLRNPMSLDDTGPWKMIKGQPPNPAFAGETMHSRDEIYIRPNLGASFYPVVLHEFGHVNGLEHVQGKAVMNVNAGEIEFSEADIEECRRVGACGLSPLDEAKMQFQMGQIYK